MYHHIRFVYGFLCSRWGGIRLGGGCFFCCFVSLCVFWGLRLSVSVPHLCGVSCCFFFYLFFVVCLFVVVFFFFVCFGHSTVFAVFLKFSVGSGGRQWVWFFFLHSGFSSWSICENILLCVLVIMRDFLFTNGLFCFVFVSL